MLGFISYNKITNPARFNFLHRYLHTIYITNLNLNSESECISMAFLMCFARK